MFGESFRKDNRFSSVQESKYDIRNTQANSSRYFFHFQHGKRNVDFALERLYFSENSLWPSNPGERDAHDSFHEQT